MTRRCSHPADLQLHVLFLLQVRTPNQELRARCMSSSGPKFGAEDNVGPPAVCLCAPYGDRSDEKTSNYAPCGVEVVVGPSMIVPSLDAGKRREKIGLSNLLILFPIRVSLSVQSAEYNSTGSGKKRRSVSVAVSVHAASSTSQVLLFLKQVKNVFQEFSSASPKSWRSHLLRSTVSDYKCVVVVADDDDVSWSKDLPIPISRDIYLDAVYLPHRDNKSRTQTHPPSRRRGEGGGGERINDNGTVQAHGILDAYPAIRRVSHSGSDNQALHWQLLHLGSSIAKVDGNTGISIVDIGQLDTARKWA
ncbi:hypothetical protein QBC44DRAFT_395156 [Cladorrhinum sp. PSN332]|nr:hypothetical protein QBC44DRAFT_395156 [Cladorrhinum sp. PSN332]